MLTILIDHVKSIWLDEWWLARLNSEASLGCYVHSPVKSIGPPINYYYNYTNMLLSKDFFLIIKPSFML